jgi:hypothetical protein
MSTQWLVAENGDLINTAFVQKIYKEASAREVITTVWADISDGTSCILRERDIDVITAALIDGQAVIGGKEP